MKNQIPWLFDLLATTSFSIFGRHTDFVRGKSPVRSPSITIAMFSAHTLSVQFVIFLPNSDSVNELAMRSQLWTSIQTGSANFLCQVILQHDEYYNLLRFCHSIPPPAPLRAPTCWHLDFAQAYLLTCLNIGTGSPRVLPVVSVVILCTLSIRDLNYAKTKANSPVLFPPTQDWTPRNSLKHY